MKPRGFNQPLYVLPFDHRGSFETGMFGWKGALSAEQTAQIAAAKQVIYDGFQKAIADGVDKAKAAILVDEQFGAAILRDAATQGFHFAMAAEKSGQEEFDFEYGEQFAEHIKAFQPTFSKVLVRYNPDGYPPLNHEQAVRLKRLSDYFAKRWGEPCSCSGSCLCRRSASSLRNSTAIRKAYDLELRPQLMVRAIEELQQAGVEPDVWKIEGLDRAEDCKTIVKTARKDGFCDNVSCIILGRGENDAKVREWLTTAGFRRRLHWVRRGADGLLGSRW